MEQQSKWETIIGLEIHAELNTKSKLFSSAPNRFGDAPNTNISEICTGQPGSLPVLNKEAVKKAVQFGCAVKGKIAHFSCFDRKSYFYPDSPRNFQITQYYHPIILGGTLIAEVENEEKSFAIHHVHLEDDAGMLKHFASFTGIDYNRAGSPLIEIVSEPCIHTPEEAVAYAMSVRTILLYIDASDCNMEEGSFRIDANISVRLKGESAFRNKIEIKNMNSFSNMEMALESEIRRQIREYTNHPHLPYDQVISPSTYRWDPDKKQTVLMRKKGSAEDYRYFPEPDLLPIRLSSEYIQEIQETLPELHLQRKRRYIEDLGLSPYAASTLINNKPLSDYFEECLKTSSNPRSICNWLIVEFAGRFQEKNNSLVLSGIPPQNISKLVHMIDTGLITGKIAKSVADDMMAFPLKDPEQIVRDNPDYQPLQDFKEIEIIVDKVIKENAQSIADFLAGKEKAFAFLVGQVMKLCRGKASPQIVNKLLINKIKNK